MEDRSSRRVRTLVTQMSPWTSLQATAERTDAANEFHHVTGHYRRVCSMMTPLSLIKAVIVRIRAPLRFALGAPFAVPSEINSYRQILAMRGSDRGRAPLAFHPTCLGGHAIWCRPGTSDWSSLADLLFQQFYLPSKVLRDPKVIVDLGCNVGYTTAHFAATYPTARVFGLELDSENFKMALKNTASWKDRVTLLNAAIWSNDGYVAFGGPQDDSYRVVASENDPVERTEQPINRLAKSITMASLLGVPHFSHRLSENGY